MLNESGRDKSVSPHRTPKQAAAPGLDASRRHSGPMQTPLAAGLLLMRRLCSMLHAQTLVSSIVALLAFTGWPSLTDYRALMGAMSVQAKIGLTGGTW